MNYTDLLEMNRISYEKQSFVDIQTKDQYDYGPKFVIDQELHNLEEQMNSAIDGMWQVIVVLEIFTM